jgi:hypothetical protein
MTEAPPCARVIPYLLGGRLDVKPSFLHGDLWVRLEASFARHTEHLSTL